MGLYESTFDPGCSFRRGGRGFRLGRSWDESVHATFSVEVDGCEYFGEIKSAFLPNNNDYNVEIVPLVYGAKISFGMPMLAACHVFSTAEISTVQKLIVQLVAAGMKFTDRPKCVDGVS